MTAIEDRLRRELPELADRLVPAERAAALAPPDADEAPGIDLDLNGGGRSTRRLAVLAAAAVLVLVAVAVGVWVSRSGGDGGGEVAAPGPTGTFVPGLAGTWRELPDAPIDRRSFPMAAWTGKELVLWAGSNLARDFAFTDGAAYDPATGTWRRLPTPGWGHPGLTSVWFDGALWALAKGNGTRFDPAAGTWEDLPQVDGMFLAATVATNDAVWGLGPTLDNTEGQTDVAIARYDQATGAWVYGPTFTGTPATGSLFGQPWDAGPTALWTGSEIVAWSSTGASPAYDPAAGTWRVLPALAPPTGTVLGSSAVMTDEGLTALVKVDDRHTTEWRLAVLTSEGWSWRAERIPLGAADPLTLGAAGHWLLALSPDEVPVAIDVRTGSWSLEDGAPVGKLGGPAVVWDGSQLYVWGGDTGSATSDVHRLEGAVWTPPSG